MKFIIWAFLITIIVGFFAAATLGAWLNWPDAGAVFAVATMGCIILHTIRDPGDKNGGTE